MYRTKMASAAIASLIAGAMSFWAAPASAVVVTDPTDTYTVNGSFTNQIDPTITGTLTVDLKTDQITAASISTGGGFGTFTTIGLQGSLGPNYFVDLTNSSPFTFFLVLDTSSTLFGGQTTTIDPISDFTVFGFPCVTCGSFTGELTVQPTGLQTAVPEPSTWAMIILGFLGIGLIARRRPNTTLRLA
jgi:hypothetical protein